MNISSGKDLGQWARARLRITGSTDDCTVSPGRTKRGGCDNSPSDTNAFTKQKVSFPAGRNLRGSRSSACSRRRLGIPECMCGNKDWFGGKLGPQDAYRWMILPQNTVKQISVCSQANLGDCIFEWKWKSVEPRHHPACSSCGMHQTNWPPRANVLSSSWLPWCTPLEIPFPFQWIKVPLGCVEASNFGKRSLGSKSKLFNAARLDWGQRWTMSCGVCLGPLNLSGDPKPWDSMLGTVTQEHFKLWNKRHRICCAPDISCHKPKKGVLVQWKTSWQSERARHINTLGPKKQNFAWSKVMSPTSSCVWPTHKCSHDICWKYPSPVMELHHDPMTPFLHSYRVVRAYKAEWAWIMTCKSKIWKWWQYQLNVNVLRSVVRKYFENRRPAPSFSLRLAVSWIQWTA